MYQYCNVLSQPYVANLCLKVTALKIMLILIELSCESKFNICISTNIQKGDKSKVNNYRPVSVLPAFFKIMTKLYITGIIISLINMTFLLQINLDVGKTIKLLTLFIHLFINFMNLLNQMEI